MWMKVDDGLHAHRKTRAVTKSHPTKSRDAAAMGLWVLAGSWAAQNGTDGWVPEDELDRWDSDWNELTSRLVRAGYWWPSEREGEAGYGFNDWLDYNPESEAASRSGSFGNHVRWHANRGQVDPECEHCPTEPDWTEDPPESGGDRGAISGGESGSESRSIALPVPDPTRPDPISRSAAAEEAFDEFWARYPRKVGKGAARKAWKSALRKVDDPWEIINAARSHSIRVHGSDEKFIPHPATWLNAERWLDEADQPEEVNGWHRPSTPPPAPPEVADDPERYAQWLADWRAEAGR